MTSVVHCKRDRYDVYIGRPSRWGNPIKLQREDDRERVLAQYIEYLEGRPDLVESARLELQGKRLGCWCAPRLCHGHVLAALADGAALEELKVRRREDGPHSSDVWEKVGA